MTQLAKKVPLLLELSAKVFRDYGIIFGFILICVYFTLTTEEHRFISPTNLLNIPNQMATITILAIGMTFVIISAGIDLSVASVLALVGVVSADLVHRGLSLPLAILFGILFGAFLGAFNGLVITSFRIPPFITTLAMMTIARGFAFVYCKGLPIGDLSEEFKFIGRGFLGYVPIPVIITIALIIIAHLVLAKTNFGRYVYAIGGNEEAARLSGINVKRVKLLVYTISGMLSGIAGLILAARLGSGDPKSAPMFELYAIAAVVLGGTSLMGGKGSVLGTVLGALLIGVIDNGLVLRHVESFYQMVLKGFVILAAVLLDRLKKD